MKTKLYTFKEIILIASIGKKNRIVKIAKFVVNKLNSCQFLQKTDKPKLVDF